MNCATQVDWRARCLARLMRAPGSGGSVLLELLAHTGDQAVGDTLGVDLQTSIEDRLTNFGHACRIHVLARIRAGGGTQVTDR
ncbi:hypothetical protein D3C78_1802100 [compost metagenome]